MRKAQTSLGGVFLIIIGLTIIITYLFQNYYPLELEKQSYLKQYNQQILLNTLNYKNAENISIKELLIAHACGKTVEIPIEEIMSEMMKPNYDYIFKAGELIFYSKQPRVILEEINPASITLNAHCNNNITITVGAYL